LRFMFGYPNRDDKRIITYKGSEFRTTILLARKSSLRENG
jgi:hypothetical protein